MQNISHENGRRAPFLILILNLYFMNRLAIPALRGLRRGAGRGAGLLRATGKEYCLTQLTMSLYYAIVVIGLCLVMGYAGQVSLGHGAFFAIGGYTSAVLTTHDFSRLTTPPPGLGMLQRAHLLRRRRTTFTATRS